MAQVRVLIVDDQDPFRQAARAVVEFTAPFVVVGSLGSAEECLAAVDELAPDLVLMDINLPGMDGIEATRLLTGRSRPVAVVLVSTYAREEYAERTRSCGAVDYIDKSAFGPDRLLAAWAAVARAGITARNSNDPPASPAALRST